MTINQALFSATKRLKATSPTPRLDAEVLLAHLLKKSREWLLAHPDEKLTELQISNFKFQIARRSRGEPVAYITNKKEFYGLKFYLDEGVLIPRPETELLVQQAIGHIKKSRKSTTVVDVGTGSGCILISLAKNLQSAICNLQFIGVDISKKALRVAKKNAKKHSLGEKLEFIQSDLLKNKRIQSAFSNRQSAITILANLPYLSKKIYDETEKSVRNFEPKSALFSREDGLNHYRELFDQIKSLATDYGQQITVLCEISPEQKSAMEKEVLSQFPKAKITFSKDLCKRWRIAKISI